MMTRKKSAPSTVPTTASAAEHLPNDVNLANLVEAARGCRGCELYAEATQTVFGVGPPTARLMLIGEQPGDVEDRAGVPFVGPAGRLLRQLLRDVGLNDDEIYFTNAVKHFRWQRRGPMRLHQKPGLGHLRACHPWLEAELMAIDPEVVVCLGATAAQSLFGRPVKITEERGEWMENPFHMRTLITYHPSALLRVPDPEAQARMREIFLTDLRRVREFLNGSLGGLA